MYVYTLDVQVSLPFVNVRIFCEVESATLWVECVECTLTKSYCAVKRFTAWCIATLEFDFRVSSMADCRGS